MLNEYRTGQNYYRPEVIIYIPLSMGKARTFDGRKGSVRSQNTDVFWTIKLTIFRAYCEAVAMRARCTAGGNSLRRGGAARMLGL
jgi:hypothetical protein